MEHLSALDDDRRPCENIAGTILDFGRPSRLGVRIGLLFVEARNELAKDTGTLRNRKRPNAREQIVSGSCHLEASS